MTPTTAHPVYPGGPDCQPHCPGPYSSYHDGYADGYERGEAEARADLLARLKAKVEGLPLMQGEYVIHAMNGTTRTPTTPADWVEAYRAAVLDAIDRAAQP